MVDGKERIKLSKRNSNRVTAFFGEFLQKRRPWPWRCESSEEVGIVVGLFHFGSRVREKVEFLHTSTEVTEPRWNGF